METNNPKNHPLRFLLVCNFTEKMAFRFLLVSSFVSLGFPVSYRRAEFRKRGHIPGHPFSAFRPQSPFGQLANGALAHTHFTGDVLSAGQAVLDP